MKTLRPTGLSPRCWSKVLGSALLAAAFALVVACGGGPRQPATPTLQPVPTTAEVIAVAQATFPGAPKGPYGGCLIGRDPQHECPITDRLRQRLQTIQVMMCLCQNGSLDQKITVETYAGGAVAHVTMWQGQRRDLFMIFSPDGRLLVDDETFDDSSCSGNADLSVYDLDPYGPCQ